MRFITHCSPGNSATTNGDDIYNRDDDNKDVWGRGEAPTYDNCCVCLFVKCVVRRCSECFDIVVE